MNKEQQIVEVDRLIDEARENKEWNMLAYWERTKEAIKAGAIPVQS